MCQEKNPLEIEVKFLVPGQIDLTRRLKAMGAVSRGRVFESNAVFDDRQGRLAGRGQLLRLRRDQRCRLTFKAPVPGADPGYKVREETELEISDIDAMAKVLRVLGFDQVFAYEKWRETFVLERAHICLDTMPFGDFVEIEADQQAIGPIAQALGLDWVDRIVLNYHQIFAILRAQLNLAFTDITFANFAGHPVDLSALLPRLRVQA
jgi:adenylate cyclase class 2